MAPVRHRWFAPVCVTIVFTGFVVGALPSRTVVAQVPDLISFQGRLTDTGGTPTEGNVSITFKIYKSNVAVWTETHPFVAVNDGVYNVLLGSMTPLNTLAFNQPMELGITVGADPEVTPRTVVASAPFALGLRGMQAVFADDGILVGYNVIGGPSFNAVAAGAVGATIGGGGGELVGSPRANSVTGDFGTISGGWLNVAGQEAAVGGGQLNGAEGTLSSIGGGYNNSAAGHASTVAGGSENSADESQATVGGGSENAATASHATVGGGIGNSAGAASATVSGGYFNSATASYAAVGGGQNNSAGASHAAVGGGQLNQATGIHSVVAGGNQNVAGGPSAAVVGGTSNRATGSHAFVAGGLSNRAIGTSSMVPGGYENRAVGEVSFAAGHRSRANHDGVFIWNDRSVTSGNDSLVSTGANQFLIRAAGGVGIGRNNPSHPLHMASGAHVTAGGVWTDASSHEWKQGFESVESRDILNRVASLPITRWQYTKEPGVVHIGPVAEDFHAAFGLGADNKHIAALDGNGVALAAIQGLLERVIALEEEVLHLREQLASE